MEKEFKKEYYQLSIDTVVSLKRINSSDARILKCLINLSNKNGSTEVTTKNIAVFTMSLERNIERNIDNLKMANLIITNISKRYIGGIYQTKRIISINWKVIEQYFHTNNLFQKYIREDEVTDKRINMFLDKYIVIDAYTNAVSEENKIKAENRANAIIRARDKAKAMKNNKENIVIPTTTSNNAFSEATSLNNKIKTKTKTKTTTMKKNEENIIIPTTTSNNAFSEAISLNNKINTKTTTMKKNEEFNIDNNAIPTTTSNNAYSEANFNSTIEALEKTSSPINEICPPVALTPQTETTIQPKISVKSILDNFNATSGHKSIPSIPNPIKVQHNASNEVKVETNNEINITGNLVKVIEEKIRKRDASAEWNKEIVANEKREAFLISINHYNNANTNTTIQPITNSNKNTITLVEVILKGNLKLILDEKDSIKWNKLAKNVQNRLIEKNNNEYGFKNAFSYIDEPYEQVSMSDEEIAQYSKQLLKK